MVSVCISWTCFVLLLSFFFCFLCLISSVVRKLIVAFLSVFRSMRSTVRIDEEERIWAVDWLIATSSIELIDLLLVAIIPLDSLLAGSHFFVFLFPFFSFWFNFYLTSFLCSGCVYTVCVSIKMSLLTGLVLPTPIPALIRLPLFCHRIGSNYHLMFREICSDE